MHRRTKKSRKGGKYADSSEGLVSLYQDRAKSQTRVELAEAVQNVNLLGTDSYGGARRTRFRLAHTRGVKTNDGASFHTITGPVSSSHAS